MENENNYKLNSEAVEALAGADSSPAPEYSKEELERYKGKKKFKIPAPVKILFFYILKLLRVAAANRLKT